jgi:Rrf2 family protein
VHILAIEEYGLRCLLQVAFHPGPGPLTGPEIARREGLGPEYVARIMRALRAGGLVVSTRGASGGYRLPRPPDQISVWEAVRALGGRFFSEEFCDCRPGRRRDCVHVEDCAVRALWTNLERALRQALERTSLEDLRRDERSMTAWLDSVASAASGPRLPSSGWPREP